MWTHGLAAIISIIPTINRRLVGPTIRALTITDGHQVNSAIYFRTFSANILDFPIANRSLNCIASNIHSTVDSSYWTNANCLANKPAICQSSPIDPDANISSITCGPAIVRPACPSEWTYYEKTQSCYTVSLMVVVSVGKSALGTI
jgi:hypothetical protein